MIDFSKIDEILRAFTGTPFVYADTTDALGTNGLSRVEGSTPSAGGRGILGVGPNIRAKLGQDTIGIEDRPSSLSGKSQAILNETSLPVIARNARNRLTASGPAYAPVLSSSEEATSPSSVSKVSDAHSSSKFAHRANGLRATRRSVSLGETRNHSPVSKFRPVTAPAVADGEPLPSYSLAGQPVSDASLSLASTGLTTGTLLPTPPGKNNDKVSRLSFEPIASPSIRYKPVAHSDIASSSANDVDLNTSPVDANESTSLDELRAMISGAPVNHNAIFSGPIIADNNGHIDVHSTKTGGRTDINELDCTSGCVVAGDDIQSTNRSHRNNGNSGPVASSITVPVSPASVSLRRQARTGGSDGSSIRDSRGAGLPSDYTLTHSPLGASFSWPVTRSYLPAIDNICIANLETVDLLQAINSLSLTCSNGHAPVFEDSFGRPFAVISYSEDRITVPLFSAGSFMASALYRNMQKSALMKGFMNNSCLVGHITPLCTDLKKALSNNRPMTQVSLYSSNAATSERSSKLGDGVKICDTCKCVLSDRIETKSLITVASYLNSSGVASSIVAL